ncbi:MerR family DNA-binding transcriptional regulator [Patescibacteria group bacterium]
MPDKQESKWLTIGQAAKHVGVSPDTLRRWEKRDKIKAFRSPTNRRYYTKKQLKMAMEGKMYTPDTKEPEKTQKPQIKDSPKPKTNLKPKKGKKVIKFFIVSFGSLIITAVIAFIVFYIFF